MNAPTPFPWAALGQPTMLFWLAAAAAPILIHLWNQRRRRETPWAATRFLLAALEKHARRARVEHWLLLAARIALVIVVVLAMTEPAWEGGGPTGHGGGATYRVLVIDGTYSMAFKPTDKSLFENAKDLAWRVVEASHQGDAFSLILLGDPPRVVIGSPALEPAEVLDELARLEPPQSRGDLPATLARLEGLLDSAKAENPRLSRAEVYILSDLGRTSWQAPTGDSNAAREFLERSRRLGEKARLVVVELGDAEGENLTISDARLAQPYAVTTSDSRIDVEIANHGRQDRPRQLLELFVDGRRAGENLVDLPAQAIVPVSFPYRFDSSGDHAIEVRLAPDLLELDNHRWLSVTVKDQLRVLCVDGAPRTGATPGATDFLRVALSPRGANDSSSLSRPELASESALVEYELDRYDLVLLANVGQFTPEEAKRLSRYVEEGGGLGVFMGDRVQAANYNDRLFPSEGRRAGLLPAGIGERVASADYLTLDPLDYDHTLLSVFRGRERAGLLTAGVREYFRLRIGDPNGATPNGVTPNGVHVALALENGDPLIVEARRGRGRVALIATSADSSWTTLPVGSAYVPIVRRLLDLLARGSSRSHDSLVGEGLEGEAPFRGEKTAVTITPPEGESRKGIVTRETGGRARWTLDEVDRSGLYRVSFADSAKIETYAVNVDAAEGDLSRLTPDDLRYEIWPEVRHEWRARWPVTEGQPLSDIVQRDSLEPALLALAVMLALVESTLACWFGTRSA